MLIFGYVLAGFIVVLSFIMIGIDLGYMTGILPFKKNKGSDNDNDDEKEIQ